MICLNPVYLVTSKKWLLPMIKIIIYTAKLEKLLILWKT